MPLSLILANRLAGATESGPPSAKHARGRQVPLAPTAPSLACVVRVGNSTDEVEAFQAIAETWGRHCHWLTALAAPGATAAAVSVAMNGTRSRRRPRVLPVDAIEHPLQMLHLLRRISGAFRGGVPDAICALARPLLFVAPLNALRALGLGPDGGRPARAATLSCGRWLMCRTQAAQQAPDELQDMSFPPACGADVGEVCRRGVDWPVALYARSSAEQLGLYASLYEGWPWRCSSAAPAVVGRLRPGERAPPRVGVLIGSLLRAPESTIILLGRLFVDPRVEYSIFVYTSPLADSEACRQAVSYLEGWAGAELRFATREEVEEEEAFEARVGSGHMRQWFKLSKAYSMMEDRERREGREFDVVLKMRTDIDFREPFSLADFPELFVSRALYTQMDMVFVCSRVVARALLPGIVEALLSRSGNERRLLPLNYDRMLRSGTGNGLPLQVFPDIGSPSLTRAVERESRWLRAEVRRHRAALEAAHHAAEAAAAAGRSVPIISGHWRFRNDTKEYQYWKRAGRLPSDSAMCSIRHWYYHVHVAEPEVLLRGWPNWIPTPLSAKRHYAQCNCEPPACVPEGWEARAPAPEQKHKSRVCASSWQHRSQTLASSDGQPHGEKPEDCVSVDVLVGVPSVLSGVGSCDLRVAGQGMNSFFDWFLFASVARCELGFCTAEEVLPQADVDHFGSL